MNSQPSAQDSVNQLADNGSIESSYTWTNLVYRGSYQFGVIAFTNQGPGEAANLSFNMQNGKLLFIAR